MATSPVTDGFAATLTSKPGRGDDLIRLMLSGLEPGNPATSEHCLVHLVSRSAGNADVAHVIEGWTSEEDHHRVFATAAAQTIVAGFADRLEGESVYAPANPACPAPAVRWLHGGGMVMGDRLSTSSWNGWMRSVPIPHAWSWPARAPVGGSPPASLSWRDRRRVLDTVQP